MGNSITEYSEVNHVECNREEDEYICDVDGKDVRVGQFEGKNLGRIRSSPKREVIVTPGPGDMRCKLTHVNAFDGGFRRLSCSKD